MKTLVFGLNPALQKVVRFTDFRLHGVNRAVEADHFSSGKGINCLRVMRTLGSGGTLVHFTGGDAGKFIDAELALEGIPVIRQTIGKDTRTCTTIIDPGGATEVIEPSPEVTASEAETLLKKIHPLLPETGLSVFCGTFPPGLDENFFEFLNKLPDRCRIVLDGTKGVAPIFKKGVYLLKINWDELRELAGADNFKEAAENIMNEYPVENIVVTDGKNPVQALLEGKEARVKVPEIKNPVNVIGAGDTFLAGLLHAMTNSLSGKECLNFATAASLARCHVNRPWDLKAADIEVYRDILSE